MIFKQKRTDDVSIVSEFVVSLAHTCWAILTILLGNCFGVWISETSRTWFAFRLTQLIVVIARGTRFAFDLAFFFLVFASGAQGHTNASVSIINTTTKPHNTTTTTTRKEGREKKGNFNTCLTSTTNTQHPTPTTNNNKNKKQGQQ